jgi:hypothetical protein
MAYTNAMACWVLPAQGLCALAAFALVSARHGPRRAADDFAGLFWALATIAILYVPYVTAGAKLAGKLGHTPVTSIVAAAVNPRYFWSGPAYLLAMPWGLGYLALVVLAVAALSGIARRDPLVGVLVVIIGVQISMTHGFLEGRSSFAFRYLAPAYPALCLLVGLGVERIGQRLKAMNTVMGLGAAVVLAASVVLWARAPRAAPVGAWRQMAEDLRRWTGTKFVFFDTGWDALRLQYEVRHDPTVRVMSDPGTGWDAGGRPMTTAYVQAVVDRYAVPGTLFFYQFDPVTSARVYDQAFAPAMNRRGCARVYRRDVPTYQRSVEGGAGALAVGYACGGT